MLNNIHAATVLKNEIRQQIIIPIATIGHHEIIPINIATTNSAINLIASHTLLIILFKFVIF